MSDTYIEWKNPIDNPPNENTDVLVYTDEDKMKVARMCRGKWDTYMRIIGWTDLPKTKPNFELKKTRRSS